MTNTLQGRYSQELKKQAVTMALHDEIGAAEMAHRLLISMKTLANCVVQNRDDH